MNRVLFFVSVFLFASSAPVWAASAKNLDVRPAGLAPSTETVAQILKSYDAAAGKRAAGVANSSSEEWSFVKAGLAGTEMLVRSGSDYYSRIRAGPLTDEYGQLLGHRWHRDTNGVVTPTQAPDLTTFEMLIFTESFHDAADPKNDASVIGVVADPQPAYVVEVKETGRKHPEWVYYDVKTGLIDRISYVVDSERVTLTYDDYRTTKSVTQPWHVHFTNGVSELDDDFVRKSLTIGEPVNIAQFAMPASKYGFVTFNGYQSLPARVFMNYYPMLLNKKDIRFAYSPTLVVAVMVNGRRLDFAVSAAEEHTIIDFSVARELGLSSYGQVTHAGGDDVSYDTILPSADIGSMHLSSIAVRATPFHYHLGAETKVVGILGYDILSSGVFRIDYEGKSLGVFPSVRFDAKTPLANAFELPISISSGLPFFSGTFDSHVTPNILFDNDFEATYVFGGYLSNWSVKDAYEGAEHTSSTIPFADAKGYGTEVDSWMGVIPDVQLGPTHFGQLQLVASDQDVTFDGHPVDAVMGGDLLQYYEIYLDYPHSRIFMRPNKYFFKHFQTN